MFWCSFGIKNNLLYWLQRQKKKPFKGFISAKLVCFIAKWLLKACWCTKWVSKSYLLFGVAILAIPSHLLGWKKWFENGLEWFENDLDKWCRIVWLCQFRGGINGWDSRYCIRIWKVEKNGWKKKGMESNGIEWFEGLGKLKKVKK